MKTKAEVLGWFESQPRTDKGFNVLNFFPRLPSILDHLKEEPFAIVQPFCRCRTHRELGLHLPVKAHTVLGPMPPMGWLLTFHFWLNDRGHERLRQEIERILKHPHWQIELEEQLTDYVLEFVIPQRGIDEDVTVEFCQDYGTLVIPLPKGETWRTFKLEICPKCGEIGKPFAVEKPSGSVYLYHRHYDIDWKPILKVQEGKCYPLTLKLPYFVQLSATLKGSL